MIFLIQMLQNNCSNGHIVYTSMALSISYIALWVAIEKIPKEEFEKREKR